MRLQVMCLVWIGDEMGKHHFCKKCAVIKDIDLMDENAGFIFCYRCGQEMEEVIKINDTEVTGWFTKLKVER